MINKKINISRTTLSYLSLSENRFSYLNISSEKYIYIHKYALNVK